MIKITKSVLQKALIAGFFSALTIGVLTVLTYKSTLGLRKLRNLLVTVKNFSRMLKSQ